MGIILYPLHFLGSHLLSLVWQSTKMSLTTNRTYWYWQLSGWFIYGSVGLLISVMFSKLSVGMVAMQLFAIIVMISATHLMRHSIKKNNWADGRLQSNIPKLLLTAVMLSIITNSFVTSFGVYVVAIIPLDDYSWGVFALYCFQNFVFISLWTALYLSVKYFRNYKQEEIEKWRLEAAVKDAELIALKAQINPHFLFNALNNIRGLILEDQMRARGMVDNLAELLRYSIQFNNQEKVSVSEELEIVKKYLELESVHYENRLSFSIHCEAELSWAKIPPMIVQLMTENAIKHGISIVKKGGNVKIALRKEMDSLVIEVTNTGKIAVKNERGIGIKNAMERINLLFDQMPEFELSENDDMVTARLKLPLML